MSIETKSIWQKLWFWNYKGNVLVCCWIIWHLFSKKENCREWVEKLGNQYDSHIYPFQITQMKIKQTTMLQRECQNQLKTLDSLVFYNQGSSSYILNRSHNSIYYRHSTLMFVKSLYPGWAHEWTLAFVIQEVCTSVFRKDIKYWFWTTCQEFSINLWI